jgi:hypothetical protein
MRKLALAIGAVAAIVVPAAPASAVEIVTEPIGRWGCGVESTTIRVAEPGQPTVTIDPIVIDVNHCLPPV